MVHELKEVDMKDLVFIMCCLHLVDQTNQDYETLNLRIREDCDSLKRW